MNSAIVIPDKIKVGYCNRTDTYTKKLAYVIYYDNKGVLRKETSWQSWRDKKIEPSDFENVPTEGFVLNKKAGGYSTGWNHRQTYCRVYDPRGFEFEITIPNLLYILENTNSIKGKGLEGEFVYGWTGKDLLLVPKSSPDYAEILNYNENLTKSVSKKEMIPGNIYLNKSNQRMIYIGHFHEYNTYSNDFKSKGKKHWFMSESSDISSYLYFEKYSSLSSILKDTGDKSEKYAEIMDRIESEPSYSPYDPEKFYFEEYKPTSLHGMGYVKLQDQYINVSYSYSNRSSKTYYFLYDQNKRGINSWDYGYDNKKIDNKQFETEEELFKSYQFYKQIKVLKNGKIAK